jgi:hypothetical protein
MIPISTPTPPPPPPTTTTTITSTPPPLPPTITTITSSPTKIIISTPPPLPTTIITKDFIQEKNQKPIDELTQNLIQQLSNEEVLPILDKPPKNDLQTSKKQTAHSIEFDDLIDAYDDEIVKEMEIEAFGSFLSQQEQPKTFAPSSNPSRIQTSDDEVIQALLKKDDTIPIQNNNTINNINPNINNSSININHSQQSSIPPEPKPINDLDIDSDDELFADSLELFPMKPKKKRKFVEDSQ